jgi:hypothetical protein
MQWLAVLLVGRLVEQGPPLLAAQRWWTNRGPHTSFKRDEEGKLLLELVASWGREVVHIFDQGFASGISAGTAAGLRFALCTALAQGLSVARCCGQPTAHLEDRGIRKRGWSQRWVWDARRARWVIATVLVLAVAHPEHPEQPLSLVVCRSQGRSPWYLLTADPIETDEQAWRVVYAYVRRWQIELSWKYEKSELAFQSPRVYEGEAREKLLLLATLAYAFLLSLLNEGTEPLRLWLLRYYCHRTGRRCRDAKVPLTRLRCALSRLWQDHPPDFSMLGTARTSIHVSEVLSPTRRQQTHRRSISARFSPEKTSFFPMLSAAQAKEAEQTLPASAALPPLLADALRTDAFAF